MDILIWEQPNSYSSLEERDMLEPLLSGLSVSGLIGFILALLWLPDRDFSPVNKSIITKT